MCLGNSFLLCEPRLVVVSPESGDFVVPKFSSCTMKCVRDFINDLHLANGRRPLFLMRVLVEEEGRLLPTISIPTT